MCFTTEETIRLEREIICLQRCYALSSKSAITRTFQECAVRAQSSSICRFAIKLIAIVYVNSRAPQKDESQTCYRCGVSKNGFSTNGIDSSPCSLAVWALSVQPSNSISPKACPSSNFIFPELYSSSFKRIF